MSADNILPPGTPVLSMDDPDFAAKLLEAIGVKPGETVTVITPQFSRTDGIQVPSPNDLDWSGLATMPVATLRALGLQPWDKPNADGEVLWLFPGEFYGLIPDGMDVVNIFGERKSFQRGVTADDTRGGALAFGVVCRHD